MEDTLSRRGRNAGISSSAHHRNQGYPSLPNQDFYIGRCRRACRAVRRRISNGDVCLGNAVWGCVNKWENRARCQAGKQGAFSAELALATMCRCLSCREERIKINEYQTKQNKHVML